jgi:hypothetical protein
MVRCSFKYFTVKACGNTHDHNRWGWHRHKPDSPAVLLLKEEFFSIEQGKPHQWRTPPMTLTDSKSPDLFNIKMTELQERTTFIWRKFS